MARYEFEQGTSSKFWEIVVRGKQLAIRFGRIGTDGQSLVKKLASEAAAEKAYAKLVAEKTAKGYRLAGAKGSPPPKATTAKKAKKASEAPRRPPRASLDVRSLYLLTEKVHPVPARRLDALERELGTKLPPGYRELMTFAGKGAFLDELVLRDPDGILEATASKQKHGVFAPVGGTPGAIYAKAMRGIDPASLVSLGTSKNGHELTFVKGSPERLVYITRDQDVLVETASLGEALAAFARSGSGFEYPLTECLFYNTGIDQTRTAWTCTREGTSVDQICTTFLNDIPHDHRDGNGGDPPTYFFFRRLQGMVAVSFWGSAPLIVWRDKDATAEWKKIVARLAAAKWTVAPRK